MGVIWENNLVAFLLLTMACGGGAAFMTGKATANQWRSVRITLFYVVPLTLASRFLHFALFGGTLLSLQYFIVDFVILAAIALLSYRFKRTSQMVTQYGWLYERVGLLSWREKTAS